MRVVPRPSIFWQRSILGRRAAGQLPGETAICLRRAALQGQPQNADLAARLGMQLADVGLVDEATWAFQHSLQLQYQPVIANRLASLQQQTGRPTIANQFVQQIALQRNTTRHREPEKASIEMPMIAQLSPDEFASVSKPVMQTKTVVPVSLASAQLNKLNETLHSKQAAPQTGILQTGIPENSADQSATKKPNPVQAFLTIDP